ncbi:MAG: endonuclease/exonuclease/phosphatase family protein [Dehalococcoidales bacterium]|nr:MAG: endonuclease/exonuclease/phosphatase family protein [Dehalococcoidales bacterium]
MKTTSGKTSLIGRVNDILLPTLSVLFGLQLLRVMIPLITWILGDRFGLSAMILGPIALAVFSFSFFSGFLKRRMGRYQLVVFSAAGLGLTRFLVQVQWSEPYVNLIISAIGTILFGIFLAIYVDKIRFRGSKSFGNLVIGILTGFVLDTALHGIFGTYDLMWQSDFPALLITVALVLLHWLTIIAFSRHEVPETRTGGSSWLWMAFGPFLFLQMIALQNIARHTVTTGWLPPYVFGWTLITQIAGLITSILLLRKNLIKLPVVLATGIVLVVSTVFPFPDHPWVATTLFLVEQISISILLVTIITGISGRNETQAGSITAANGTGFLLFCILTLAYYAVYQINLPYTNTTLEVVAALLIALCALVSCLKTGNRDMAIKTSWVTPLLVLVLLVMPLMQIFTYREPVETEGNGFPVTVMTYNLHNGFNTGGDLDMDALALVIEENDPDIIALQEISRGWLISGRMDMLEWLSQRLDMPYISGPTEGQLWGNAILSRFPIVESSNYDLPPRDLFLRRGFLITKIDIGNGEYLTVIATHLHHIYEDSEIRQQQVPVILETWDNAEMTVIAGDLNAEPDSPEMKMLHDAGFFDVMSGSIPPKGYTYHSADLYQRIDYIWITPDLTSRNAKVIQSIASDHLPVIVEIAKY